MGTEIEKKQIRGQAEVNKTSKKTETPAVEENLELQDVETQTFTMEQMEEMMNRKFEQREKNSVQLGATLQEITEYRGEKKDKLGNIVLLPDNTPDYYPTSYTAILLYNGGSLDAAITPALAQTLIVGKRYYCEGVIGECRAFGKTYMGPNFSKFTQL